MSTERITTTEARTRSSKDIQKEIVKLGEMEVKKVAELEKLEASLPSEVDANKLIVAEALGNPDAKIKLVDIRAKNQEGQRMKELISAIHNQLPELRREQGKAELGEAVQEEKRLGKKNQAVEVKIKEHVSEAARLLDQEWIPREKERYSLRVKWGSGGRTPKQIAFGWLRGHFGPLLYPYLELPPQPRQKR